jgi:serine/threonine protein kinase
LNELLFHPGDAIDGFEVLFHCGAGAFGQVYLVRDGSGRQLALKVLSPDRRGERELAGLLRFQRVTHPNLLHIDKISTLPDGRIFYTMDAADNAGGPPEYAPDTLARRMRKRGSLLPDELKRIMPELAEGLAALHRAHLTHRDIKPENILFLNGRATLADAGAVGEFDGTTLVGTPEYLPPEVCLGKRAFTAADDCRALGLVLYSALTGEAPRKFPSTPRTLASPEEVALFKAAQRACVPPGISAYLFRELLKHPDTAVPRRKWRRIAFAAAAVILLCMVLAAVVLYKKHPPTPSPAPEKKPTMIAEPPQAPPAPATAAAKRPEPTAAELVKKYQLSAEEQRLVDKWMAECVSFDRRINTAYLLRNKALVSKLTAEKKARLPYGIDDFCGDEMRTRKLLGMLTREYTPAKRHRLEAALQFRRDELKKLLDRLPPEELAKWQPAHRAGNDER